MNFIQRFALCAVIAGAAIISIFSGETSARPITKKGGSPSPQVFYRQRNTFSNLDFFFSNKGVIFNSGATGEGLFYPRGQTSFYIFGGGLWFATKKQVGSAKRKLCEVGYNPNSAAGWYTEGEIGSPNPDPKNYISYVSPRYSANTGQYTSVANAFGNTASGNAIWPIWDTSATKTLNRNYYFGDYISSVAYRATLSDLAVKHQALPNGKVPKPAMLSQEDIVNIYSDQDVTANPEYRPGTGYPFNLNIVEVIYSWSFGKFRDLVFLRRRVTNMNPGTNSTEIAANTLTECFMSGAFDPDLGLLTSDAATDDNTFFGLTKADSAFCRTPYFFPDSGKRPFNFNAKYYSDPFALNMAYQWKPKPVGDGRIFGVVGFTFLESPVVNQKGDLIDISDSAAMAVPGNGGYCKPNELGLHTFRRWTISNDPPTQDLRYDFQSSGSKDGSQGGAGNDQRLLFSTGPFDLPPGKTVESVIGIGIAWPSTKNLHDNVSTGAVGNIDSCVRLIAFAHHVFEDTVRQSHDKNSCDSVYVTHFITPNPPNIPTLHTTCLDRAVLLTWDTLAEKTLNPLSSTLPFNTYDLYRTTRADHDSTIRPDGNNPIIHIGSWSVYNLRVDTLHDTLILKNNSKFIFANGIKYTRTNPNTPNPIPHSFLDVGDDNGNGILETNEGLFNNVKYYYFLTATNEFDSINKIGPLTTSIVNGKNFVIGIPCKPVFPDLPSSIAGDSTCFNGSLPGEPGCDPTHPILPTFGSKVSLEIQDTGKFVQLYSNDTMYISFQPRWTEFPGRSLNQSFMSMYVDFSDNRQGKVLTYDQLFNPAATPSFTPFNFNTGILEQIIGQGCDTNITGRFNSNSALFQPYQTIDQAFDFIVDYQIRHDKAPYSVHSIVAGTPSKQVIVGLTARTERNSQGANLDYSNIGEALTVPSFQGSLGTDTYEITFGPLVSWSEAEYDTTTHTVFTQSDIKDPNAAATDFQPKAMEMIIKSLKHCDPASDFQKLSVIRAANQNDVAAENDPRFYNQTDPKTGLPNYANPDSMIVPLAGKFAVDAFHYSGASYGDATASFMTKTIGKYYFPSGQTPSSNGKFLNTVHRLRLGGAEFTLNFPQITGDGINGDTASYPNGPASADFQPGEKITISFTGLMEGLPFPGAKFAILTTKLNFASDSLYGIQKILNQVQVVPNPYIVTNLGQTSTDNAKLFFTRLPPRATIEIYNIAGELVKSIEHQGGNYSDSTSNPKVLSTTDPLLDRYNVEEWNLLSSGNQRVGSQVFIARIIAKDPADNHEIGETTTKFAVVVGGYRIVH